MSKETAPRPGKRLALFFDGTWNTPESKTNVWELYQLLADKGADGVTQLAYYDEGVTARAAFDWILRASGNSGVVYETHPNP